MLAYLLVVLLGWLPAAPASAATPPPDSVRRAPLDSLLQVQCPGYSVLRVATILFVGNEVTKERILRAELDFREGDTITAAKLTRRLETNRLRMFNLQLFHGVLAQAVCRNGEITVLFSVQERWYTFPIPILSLADRNFRSWLDRPDRWRRVDYGLHLERKNFRGRNEEIRGNLQLGFNRKYELFYDTPGYGKLRRLGFGVGASYYRSHSLDYATVNDRLANFRDEVGFPIQRQYLTAGLRWRYTVQRRTLLDISYHREAVSDSVVRRNPDYFLGATRREYVDIALTTVFNHRNTFAYPLTGHYLRASAVQRIFTCSAPPITTLQAQIAKYMALGHNFYYSATLLGQVRVGRRIAYADNRALGYTELVRGYDQYVVDGRHYGLFQQGVSYRLLDAGRLKLRGIHNPKVNSIPLILYLNTFTDAGYVAGRNSAYGNSLPNRLQAAAGIGLHLVTYYDRVITLEYTRNAVGQGGFFLRTEFPI
ncbi:BamA/TamA family outer membrane protein [Hymenobacter metallicola]|uniref:BamA/TamA family outer membrane protein n=1 Tax=Hymenobacter metallicola TaxID=2563114 RepID=UPI001436BCA4|nr:BamA/TamA family outer membrane protein [Hymenobacter metallicola]